MTAYRNDRRSKHLVYATEHKALNYDFLRKKDELCVSIEGAI